MRLRQFLDRRVRNGFERLLSFFDHADWTQRRSRLEPQARAHAAKPCGPVLCRNVGNGVARSSFRADAWSPALSSG